MLCIHISLIIFTIFTLIFIYNNAYNKYLKDIIKENESSCCITLDLLNYPRIKPPIKSFSYGWSQESKLKSYVDSSCPINGIFVCSKSIKKSSNYTHIQFLSNKGQVIYENSDESNASIWVRCLNKNWLIEGKPFSAITCSQK
uniref:C-type lectin domain-containing protein n=1 Tax=Strongyloides stercoralis TaxID=6248 RepID=A0A0K0EJ42_STRER